MASVKKLPFEPNRYEKTKKAGGNLAITTKQEKSTIEIPLPVVPPWADDSSWEDYKSRASGSTMARSSRKQSSKSIMKNNSLKVKLPPPDEAPMTDDIKTPKTKSKKPGDDKQSIPPKLFSSQVLQNENSLEPKQLEDLSPRRFSINPPASITSGLIGMHSISVSSLASSEMRQMSPSEAMYRGLVSDRASPPLRYCTLKFDEEGHVNTTTSFESNNERVVHYPIGEFYKPSKLTKSITLPTLQRPSLHNFNGSESLASLASLVERSATADNMLNDLSVSRKGGGITPITDEFIEFEEQEIETGSISIRTASLQSNPSADAKLSPKLEVEAIPPVPYQIHNRVLGSKFLLPLSRSGERIGLSRGIDTTTSGSLLPATTTPQLPFQIHKRIMGWKLTSLQKRKDLVKLLDIVNGSEEGTERLRQAFEEQGISSQDIGTPSPQKDSEDMGETQKRIKQTSKRMAASWERTVSRMVKARVGALDAKAEFHKQKHKREEQRKQKLLSVSMSPEKLGFFDSSISEFDTVFAGKQSLLSARYSSRDLMKPSFEIDPKILTEENAGLSTSLAHNIRALSPPLLRPVETYTSTSDLLISNDRLDILKTAELLRKGMAPAVSPPRIRTQFPSDGAGTSSEQYFASYLHRENAPRSPPNVRVASPPVLTTAENPFHGRYTRTEDDDMTAHFTLTSEIPIVVHPENSTSVYSLSVDPLKLG